jgi:hypothetical protein
VLLNYVPRVDGVWGVEKTVLRWVEWASVEASESGLSEKRISNGREEDAKCRGGGFLVAGRSGSTTLLCWPSDLTEDAQQEEGGNQRLMGN